MLTISSKCFAIFCFYNETCFFTFFHSNSWLPSFTIQHDNFFTNLKFYQWFWMLVMILAWFCRFWVFGRADMPQHFVFCNRKFSTSLCEYSNFLPSEAMTARRKVFIIWLTTQKHFLNAWIYYLFLEFDIANEKQTYNVN